MKAKNLFFGALTCLAFAACSNDDEPIVNGGGAQGQNSYMAVNLTMVSDITRAVANDQTYRDGTEAENAVSVEKAKFYFYDRNGGYLTTGQLAEETETGEGEYTETDGFLDMNNFSDTPNIIEEQSNAIIVLGPTTTAPYYVIAVLNSEENYENITMQNMYSQVMSDAITGAKGSFVMTNSTYLKPSGDSYTTVYAQEVGTVYSTINEAVTNPVDIYVERVVAKVGMTNGAADLVFDITNKEVLDNNSGTNKVIQMKVTVDGWKLNAVNTSTYSIKNLQSSNISHSSWFGSAASHRSYWAADENYTGSSVDYTGDTYNNLTYYTWNDAKNAGTAGNSTYCYENTVNQSNAQAEGGDRTNVSTILIAATASYSLDGGSTWVDGANLYRYGGMLYTEDAYKNLYLNELSKLYVWADPSNTENYQDIVDADITWSFVEAGTSSADNFKKVKLNAESFTNSDTGISTYVLYVKGVDGKPSTPVTAGQELTTINGAFDSMDMAKKTEGYLGGKCYYQVPIEHLGSTAGNLLYGVVRNHIYELTLTNITNLGDAVYYPDKNLEYIPGKKTNYYVAARLNILSWRVVSQNVEL